MNHDQVSDVLILLRSVRAHLQPQKAYGLVHVATPEDDVVIMDGLASASEHSVAKPEGTVFNDNIPVAAIAGVLVCPGAFPAFQGNRVVVDRHIAPLDQYVAACVDVDGVGGLALSDGLEFAGL